MAIIAGVTVDFTLSPRVIRIPLPGGVGRDIFVVDLQDTLQDIEDNEEDGILYPRLRDCSGGDSLGGVAKVGYTLKLLNAQIMFEGLPDPKSVGSASTDDPTGTILTDSTADFEADGIVRGAKIVNWTSKAMTVVTKILGPTQLQHVPLDGGTRGTWLETDDYSVYPLALCTVGGGNVLAVDENGVDIPAVMASLNVVPQIEKASSGVLLELSAVQFAAFDEAVNIDAVHGMAGTGYPIGTVEMPVDNMADALTIAEARGFTTFRIHGDFEIDGGMAYIITNSRFVGRHALHDRLTMGAAAVADGCIFECLTVSGTLDGGSVLQDCVIGDLTYVEGLILRSFLQGTITLGGNGLELIDCRNSMPSGQSAVIDMGGGGRNVAMHNFSGHAKLQNMSVAGTAALSFGRGKLTVDASVSAGLVHIMGLVSLTDESTGTAVVKTDFMMTPGADRRTLSTIRGLAAKAAVG